MEMLQADIDDGAPTNPDGTMNLVQYAAWLVKEMARGAIDSAQLRPSELCRLLELHAAGRGDQRAAALSPPHAGGLPHRRRPRTSTCSATSPGWSRSGTRPGRKPTAIPTRR